MWSVRVFTFVLVLIAIGHCDDTTTQVIETDAISQIVLKGTNNTNDAEYERNNDDSFFANCQEENVICVFRVDPEEKEDCIKGKPQNQKGTCEVKKEKVAHYLNSDTGVMISPTSTGARIDARMQKEHNETTNEFQFDLKHGSVTNNKMASFTVERANGNLALRLPSFLTFNVSEVDYNILRGTIEIGEVKQNKEKTTSEKNKDGGGEGGMGGVGWKGQSTADKTVETKGNVEKENPKEKVKEREDAAAQENMSTRNLIITISVSSIFFLFFIAFIIVAIVQCRVKSRRRRPSKKVNPPPSISSTSAKPSINQKTSVKISISAKEEESLIVKTAIAKSEVDVKVMNTTTLPVWSNSSSDEDAEVPFVSVSAKSVKVSKKKRGSTNRGSVTRDERRNKPLPPGSIPLHPTKKENSSRRRRRV